MDNGYLEAYRGSTVLITGGAGAIGANLTKAVAGLGAKMVIVLDNLSSAGKWNVPGLANVMFVEGDIRDEVKLKRVFFERPDFVFHLAAFFANQNSLDHPETDLDVNGVGALRVMEYSLFSGVRRFVYASSGCSVYGSGAPLPLKEDFISMNLSTPYQITKMLGELYCNFFYNHYGLPAVRTRFFNSYGPGEIPGQYRNVVPNFIYWAMKGEDLPITGTGEETRDFTFVEDLVDGLLRAGYYEEAIGEEFNLASGRETKIIDLAKMVIEAVGSGSGIRFAQRRKWDDKSRRLASVAKAGRLLGYSPGTGLKEGLPRAIEWFRENWDAIDRCASFGPGLSSAVRDRGAAPSAGGPGMASQPFSGQRAAG